MTTHTFTITEDHTQQRLDKFLASQLPDYSRKVVQDAIKAGNVEINNAIKTDQKYKTKPNDVINITLDETPSPSTMQPANIKLDVIFEDEHLAIINKQAGLTVHPGAGNHNDTLANALVHHFGDSLSSSGGTDRPGIVHRLDKDTSGLMLIAKHDKSHRKLSKMIERREVTRRYLALVWGQLVPLHGTIDKPIGRNPKERTHMCISGVQARDAITHYETKHVYTNQIASLVECQLETGRTHQIRVHLHHLQHPVIGDATYGKRMHQQFLARLPLEIQQFIQKMNRHSLHAYFLGLEHPITGTYMEYEAGFPPTLQELALSLEGL